jgi:hypothetical protein
LEILDTLARYQALKTRLRCIIQCSSHNRIVSVRCGFIELLVLRSGHLLPSVSASLLSEWGLS